MASDKALLSCGTQSRREDTPASASRVLCQCGCFGCLSTGSPRDRDVGCLDLTE